ncbi:MAG: MFS transporter [Gemmatimonadetes bacterium]|nr:MFS transporter [Gemmatimonadota bacterium]
MTPAGDARPPLPRNVKALAAVSFLTDVSSEMIYPLLPVFLTTVLGAGAGAVGTIEGIAESTAALLKLASGWWSDRVRRKPLVLFGYGLAAVARPLMAMAGSAGQVLAVRMADRVGKGVRSSPRDALIADVVEPSQRGRAFGVHRAADNAGAVLGPLIAWALLQRYSMSVRSVMWWAAVPGALAVVVIAVWVREGARSAARSSVPPMRAAAKPVLAPPATISGEFWRYLAVLFLFTLSNSSDAFLLLRATQLGVPVALIPVLWACLSVVKSASSIPGGTLSDRVGRKPLIVGGWIVYSIVYILLATANAAWQLWALFAVYGVYFGLTEGVEKAMVADLVPAERRGAAYGWYNFTVGLGALPASVLFGVVWERWGAAAAFQMGAVIAALAAVAMLLVVREPNARPIGRLSSRSR